MHGSDSPENGQREIGIRKRLLVYHLVDEEIKPSYGDNLSAALWFGEGELSQWTPALAPWLRE